MEMDITDELAAASSASAQDDLDRGITLYNQGDHVGALYYLVEAAEKIAPQEDESAEPSEEARTIWYFMYKAYAMCWRDKSRTVEPTYNLMRLEGIVANDPEVRRRRAVMAYSRFGPLGLRVHDYLERHGR